MGLRLSAEDRAIIRVLRQFHSRSLGGCTDANYNQTDLTSMPQFDPPVELPPPATRAWHDVAVIDLGETGSLLFLHDPTVPEELRHLAEAVETSVRSALTTANAARRVAVTLNRGVIRRRVIEFLERVQSAYDNEDVADLSADHVSRPKDFVQDLRRRYRCMRASDTGRVRAVDPQDIANELARISGRIHDLVGYVGAPAEGEKDQRKKEELWEQKEKHQRKKKVKAATTKTATTPRSLHRNHSLHHHHHLHHHHRCRRLPVLSPHQSSVPV